MAKMGQYQPPDKYKNYTASTSKPTKSHMFYEEHVKTLQEEIYKKLKTITKSLESIYPKLANTSVKKLKITIDKNLGVLTADLKLLQITFDKKPYTFNTVKLKTNQKLINEMKNVCTTLHTQRFFSHDDKKISKLTHTLHELELLIKPTALEVSNKKASTKAKASAKAAAAKKPKAKTTVAPKKKAAPVKKAVKPKTKPAVAPKKKAAPIKKTIKPKTKIAVPAKKKTSPVKKAVPIKKVIKPKKTVKKPVVATRKAQPKKKTK